MHYYKLILFSTMLVLIHSPAYAVNLVVPQSNTSVEGGLNNQWPFYTSDSGFTPSMRYQQVYAAAEFAPLASAIQITQIAFRPDAQFGFPFSETLTSVRIDLSTTQKAPDSLSQTFAANVGADDVTVVPTGPLTISSAFTGPGPGPKDFDIVIDLTTPFVYNPATGNLLLDIRNLNGGGPGITFDATPITLQDGISREWAVSATSATATNSDSQGLITRFTYTAVPEPSTIVLAGLGAIGLLFARRRFAS